MNRLSSRKAVLTVTEMAAVVRLCRDRFYDLVREGVFPPPMFLPCRRPYYTPELQERCVRVRAEGIGVNGVPVIFYRTRRGGEGATHSSRPDASAGNERSADPAVSIKRELEHLGWPDMDLKAIRQALSTCFPDGTDNVDRGELLRQLIQYFNQRHS
jgi:hypothetical protein